VTETAVEPAVPAPAAREAARPVLVLIDGYSLLFRAYLTPGPYLATSGGQPTGAVHGFTNMLLTLLTQEKPDAVYVAWDAPGKTFRDEKFDQYKAHRPEVAQDLRSQFPIARRVVEALGVAAAEAEGFEADDLIGTLATRGAREGWDVVIVTGDSDQLQLVGGGVCVRMTRTGVSNMETFDAERVREKYGVPPERIPDLKALVGDTSDNIPGVPGIGKVTAAKLLQEFGSVEALLERAAELPEKGAKEKKVKDALLAGVEQARLSLELATIHCDAPFTGPIQRYDPTLEIWAGARAVFAELEFKSLASRLPSEPGAPPPTPPEEAFDPVVTVIASAEELDAALEAIAGVDSLALRLDLDGPSPMRARIRGVAFAAGPDRGWYVPIGEAASGAVGGLFDEAEGPFSVPLEALEDLLEDGNVLKAGYDAKLAQVALTRQGLGVYFAFDALVAAYVLQPGRSGYPLGQLAEEHLARRLEGGPTPEGLAREAALLHALWEPMTARIEADGASEVFYSIEIPLIPVLVEMERTGVPVDRVELERLSAEMAVKIEALAARIYELAGEEFSIGSTQQLQRILFEKLQLPTGKKIKTGFSTRADLLESLADQYEIAGKILEYRELTKLKSTYADALPKLINPETGRIHTSLNQTVAATGRLSSSDPNLQNIPIRSEAGRRIRKAFVAPEGQTLLSCDYSQIELRVFAHVTRDPELLRAFGNDEDIHAATAGRVFGVPLDQVTPEMRRQAKTVNFAVIYGQSDFGLASTLKISNAEAKEFIDNYFAQFPGVREYTERTLEQARERGYVETLLGRRRYVPEIASGNFNIRQAAERAAVNMPIQGAAADIMKLAMLGVSRRLASLCYNCTLLLQVHDELVFGVNEDALPEVLPEIIHEMENAYAMDVPLRVDAKAGPNWAEMKSLDVRSK
jgi:DNA polymerase-1